MMRETDTNFVSSNDIRIWTGRKTDYLIMLIPCDET